MEQEPITEVPQNLQMLVRLVVRGFYSIEDVLIVDMLVRNLCMNEDDLCDLLKFDRKMLRQRISTLKADKLVQTRMKSIILEDGKSQREQYYFVNYTSFVNVVKYKLDHIRKKLEMEERDQTSRASFKCDTCERTYTDLEADQLLNLQTGELHCIICRSEVREDMSGVPRHDTRILLSKFNSQMEQLFTLLKEVENIKLSSDFAEPVPQEFGAAKKNGQTKTDKVKSDGRTWSGEATKKSGFKVDSSIDVTISNENGVEDTVETKEKPVWLTDATSFIKTNITSSDPAKDALSTATSSNKDIVNKTSEDDVMSLLQEHESKDKSKKRKVSDSDSDDSPDELFKRIQQQPLPKPMPLFLSKTEIEEITISDGDSSDSASDIEPMVRVAGELMPISKVGSEAMAKMRQDEKNSYIKAYQDYYGSMDD